MKRLQFAIPLFALLATNLFSCKKAESYPKPFVYLTSQPAVDQYLVDKDGNSLYYFANDADGLSNCTGGCLAQWPVYYEDMSGKLMGEGLDAADFATITTAAGAKQTTYKGWPLYYHSPLVAGVNTREKPGELTGQGIGNIWFVAKPDYSLMIANYQLTGGNGKTYRSDYTEGTGRTAFLVDRNGTTLYTFRPDSAFKNKFTRSDFSNNVTWQIVAQPLLDLSQLVVPTVVDKTQFSTTNVFGRTQLTYKGWPIYTHGPDNRVRASTKGVSVALNGNIPNWPVLNKDVVPAPR